MERRGQLKSDATLTFRDEIDQFFLDYLEAFARRDADALCALWDAVGLFPSQSGNFAMSRDAFRDHCVTLMAFYQHQGVVRPTGRILSVEELFPNVALVRISYRMLGSEDALVAGWEHVYILRRSDRWRVSLTLADGEMAAWTALGVHL